LGAILGNFQSMSVKLELRALDQAHTFHRIIHFDILSA